MPQKCETPAGTGASRNSLDSFRDALNPTLHSLQLPPIIARHLWRPDELAVIEAASMLAIALMGGACHG